jgi:dihydrofolate reductase
LVTELRIYVHPVVIGAGKPLFAPGARHDLELLENRRFGNGVVLLHYSLT